MSKRKLEFIENYIFAKTLNLLAKNTNVSRENTENYNIVNLALTTSNNLLLSLEEDINNNIDNASFLILKKELENPIIYSNKTNNLLQIKRMISKITKEKDQQ